MTEKTDAAGPLSAEAKRQWLAQLLRQKVEAARGWEPLSHSQRLYWALQRAAPPDVPVNNEGFAWRVQADFDFDVLIEMAQKVSERHPGLRTTYQTVGDVPLQRFNPRVALQPEVIDASGWSLDELNEQIITDTSRPFNLERDPVLRTLFYSRGRGEAVVVTAVHHLALDLWSMVLVLEELKTLYLARLLQQPPRLPATVVHYRDFAAWQEQLVRGPQGRRLEDYWGRQLERPPPPLELPLDRSRPAHRSYRGATVGFQLDPEVSARIKGVARTEQTTLFKIVLAALEVVLERWSGQQDFFIATRGAGRSRSDFEGVVGCFTNTLPLRSDLRGNPTFRQLLERVGRTVTQALEHQDYPFSLLTQKHRITRSGEPLCEVCFVFQKPYRTGAQPAFQQGASLGIRSQTSTGALFALGDSRVDILPIELPVARYDLELEMLDTGEWLSGWMRYSTDLFEAPTIRRLLETLEAAIDEATANPDLPLSELRLDKAARFSSVIAGNPGNLLP